MSLQAKLILWLVSVFLVLAALFGAYRYGRYVEGLARDRQQLAAVTEAVKRANEIARLDREASGRAAEQETARQVADAKRTSRVEQSIAAHPEYQTCALSPADLAELNNAIEGK